MIRLLTPNGWLLVSIIGGAIAFGLVAGLLARLGS